MKMTTMVMVGWYLMVICQRMKAAMRMMRYINNSYFSVVLDTVTQEKNLGYEQAEIF